MPTDIIRRSRLLAYSLAAALFLGLVAPAVASEPPGRAASSAALARVLDVFATGHGGGDVLPTENISLIREISIDPLQPGVTPGGGDVEP